MRYSTWAVTSGLTARDGDLGSEVTLTAARLPPTPGIRAPIVRQIRHARDGCVTRILAPLYRTDILIRHVGHGHPRPPRRACNLHGYQIRALIAGSTWAFWPMSRSVPADPALTRLEKSGAVVATEGAGTGAGGAGRGGTPHRLAERRARRPAGPPALPDPGPAGPQGVPDHRRRPRPLRRAAARAAAPPRTPAASGSAWPSPGTWRPRPGSALLERRRALLVQRLGDAEAARTDLDVYARSVVQHTADGVARDISWLDSLIASERAALATEPVA